MMSNRFKCRDCSAAVICLHAVNAARMPLNADPDQVGNCVIKGDKVHVLQKDDLFDSLVDGERYMPHHATGPKRAEFQKSKE
jgi:hypothetical protein